MIEPTEEEILQIQALDDFLRTINDELTVACLIPITLPKQRVLGIIEEAKKWFYKNYEDSVEEQYYVLDKENYHTDSFKKTKSVVLPKGIISVFGVHEVQSDYQLNASGLTNQSGLGKGDDFNARKFMMEQTLRHGDNGEKLMMYVIHEKYYDMVKELVDDRISYYYNRLTRRFSFKGEIPEKSCVLAVYNAIDDASLFTDEIFYRYVVAQCKRQLSRVMGTFQYQLPGNIEINYDLLREEGAEELENIKTEIKEDEGVDYFMVSN